MKKIKKFQKFVTSSLLLLLVFLCSCSNQEETTNERSAVRVSTMGQFMPLTRGESTELSNMPVLQFRDETTYNAIVNKLKAMTEEERKEYMKALGFNSAEQLINTADEELDSIFDIDEENLFETSLSDFMTKYTGLLAFGESDPYDVTPYLSFTDSTMEMVGNANGYVVIGDKLIGPQSNDVDSVGDYTKIAEVQTRTAAVAPIQPGFRKFGNASLTIKNGKYKSTMTLGRIIHGNSFAVEFVTKKHQFLWKKKVKAAYSLNLEMSSSKFHNNNIVTCPYGKTVCILNLPLDFVGDTFNAIVRNFKSSKGKTIGSATFKNIQVK